jgi:hypothetical protein
MHNFCFWLCFSLCDHPFCFLFVQKTHSIDFKITVMSLGELKKFPDETHVQVQSAFNKQMFHVVFFLSFIGDGHGNA